ncbi:MAG TPA: hypothetical protein VFM77_17590 [Terriglobales bacterium]|nr:hypothetical protein [Terriglobales bacterium]
MGSPKTHPLGAVILALIIAILIQIPFAFIFILPSFSFGVPGAGGLFFAPAFTITRLFARAGSISIAATIAVQAILTFIPIFWLVTWKRRPVPNSVARVVAFTIVVIAATAIAGPLERRHEARVQAAQINGKSPVLSSIQRLNGSLAFFKKRYGQYPDSLSQLDFPPDQAEVDSRHTGLIQFPLPMQDFFNFTYAREGTGYDLRVDGKPGQGWELYHYCTNDSAAIRFDNNSQKCKQGTVVYSKPR